MKLFFASALLLSLSAQQADAAGGGQFFTYFPLGGLGPERWPSLQLDGNQCAGTNLVSGYGQSPVAIPDIPADQCDSNTKKDYQFNGGDCTWDDLEYSISNNGVKVAPKSTPFGQPVCTIGGMKIPHLPFDYWDAVQFHIHSWSEHTVGGEYFNAELHSVHMIKSKVTTAAAVWGTMISVGAENPVFENYIRGWEKVAADIDAKCSGEPAATPEPVPETLPVEEELPAEEGEATPEQLPTEEGEGTPVQLPAEEPVEEPADELEDELVTLPVVEGEEDGAGGEATPVEESSTDPSGRKLADQPAFEGLFGAKCRTNVHAPQPYLSTTPIAGTTPDIYRHLHNTNDADGFPTYGTYTYKGGLTTPPCSEIVNWNLLDTAFEISADQMNRLLTLIDCYQNADTCGYETVAAKLDSEESAGLLTQSSTSRPPQDLQGRTITHRCYDGPNTSIPDKSPKSPPVDDFVKSTADYEENANTKSAKCADSIIYKDCPEDPRADPTASPNLRANAPVWGDFDGYWYGTYRAVDRNGNPLRERFASTKIGGDLPYSQTNVQVFKNITVRETRYYEHTYFVFPAAAEDFCSLPVPAGAKNVLGSGKCGENGLVRHAERIGTATHEKDGSVVFVVTGGRIAGTTGEAAPVGKSHIYFQNSNDGFSYSETFSFSNDEKTKMTGTGEYNIFANYFPYKEDPLAEVYTFSLSQTDQKTWVDANKAAQKAANIKEMLPAPLRKNCLPEEKDGKFASADPCADLEEKLSAVDPLTTPSPYEESSQVKGGFIAGMVILGVLILLGILYYLHLRQIKAQKARINKQFARRVAETIKIEGSHTQLTAEALKEEFDRIDKDHSGQLDKEELRTFVNSGKIGTLSESDFNALWAALDVDGDGEVNFTEFCSFLAQCGEVYDQEEEGLTPEERRLSIARRLSEKSNRSQDKDLEEGK